MDTKAAAVMEVIKAEEVMGDTEAAIPAVGVDMADMVEVSVKRKLPVPRPLAHMEDNYRVVIEMIFITIASFLFDSTCTARLKKSVK